MAHIAAPPLGLAEPAHPCEVFDRAFDINDPCFSTDNFRMYEFKKAKRRCPKKYRYSGTACPQFRKEGVCIRGDACPYAHGVFECWLHPTRYRTQLCTDGSACRRRVCFFAHLDVEVRQCSPDVHPPLGTSSALAELAALAGLDPGEPSAAALGGQLSAALRTLRLPEASLRPAALAGSPPDCLLSPGPAALLHSLASGNWAEAAAGRGGIEALWSASAPSTPRLDDGDQLGLAWRQASLGKVPEALVANFFGRDEAKDALAAAGGALDSPRIGAGLGEGVPRRSRSPGEEAPREGAFTLEDAARLAGVVGGAAGRALSPHAGRLLGGGRSLPTARSAPVHLQAGGPGGRLPALSPLGAPAGVDAYLLAALQQAQGGFWEGGEALHGAAGDSGLRRSCDRAGDSALHRVCSAGPPSLEQALSAGPRPGGREPEFLGGLGRPYASLDAQLLAQLGSLQSMRALDGFAQSQGYVQHGQGYARGLGYAQGRGYAPSQGYARALVEPPPAQRPRAVGRVPSIDNILACLPRSTSQVALQGTGAAGGVL